MYLAHRELESIITIISVITIIISIIMIIIIITIIIIPVHYYFCLYIDENHA